MMIDTMAKPAIKVYDESAATLQSLMGAIDKNQLRLTVELLHKMVSNIAQQPLEPKFRRVPKTSKSLQEKVLPYKHALHFLKLVGFEENAEAVFLDAYDKDRLDDGLRAMEHFVEGMGAKVKSNSDFDPFKMSVSSTTAMSTADVIGQNNHKSKLDVQLEETARLKREKIQNYEGKLDDREIEVYNYDSMVKLAQQKKAQEIWEQEKAEKAEQEAIM